MTLLPLIMNSALKPLQLVLPCFFLISYVSV